MPVGRPPTFATFGGAGLGDGKKVVVRDVDGEYRRNLREARDRVLRDGGDTTHLDRLIAELPAEPEPPLEHKALEAPPESAVPPSPQAPERPVDASPEPPTAARPTTSGRGKRATTGRPSGSRH